MTVIKYHVVPCPVAPRLRSGTCMCFANTTYLVPDPSSLLLSLLSALLSMHSVTCSSTAALNPHPLTSRPNSPVLLLIADRSSCPNCSPMLLQLTSSCCNPLLTRSMLHRLCINPIPAPLLLRLSCSRGAAVFVLLAGLSALLTASVTDGWHRASHTAWQPSSPKRFKRRFRQTKALLCVKARPKALPLSACSWLSDKSNQLMTLCLSINLAKALSPRSLILHSSHSRNK